MSSMAVNSNLFIRDPRSSILRGLDPRLQQAVLTGDVGQHADSFTAMVMTYVNQHPDMNIAFRDICNAYNGNASDPTNQAAALTILGICFQSGSCGLPRHDGRALQFAEKAIHIHASDVVQATALNLAGDVTAKGKSEQALPNAIALWRQASQLDHVFATYSLARCYKYGTGIDKNSGKVDELYAKGFKQRQKEADAGDIEAMAIMGAYYYRGFMVEQSLEIAVRWFRKAADKEHVGAMNNLGRCYHEGWGVQQDSKLAFGWYSKAATKGYLEAMYYLGLCYQNGFGTETNPKTAVQWYTKAAKAGDVRAMQNLAWCYQEGFGIGQDLRQALYWYTNAAEAGSVQAMLMLAQGHAQGLFGKNLDIEPLIKYYAPLGSQMGVMIAEYFMSYYPEDIARNLRASSEWIERAAAAGDVDAMNELGQRYQHGYGVEPDMNEAVSWYKKAADRNHITALRNLAWCYQNGFGITRSSQNFSKGHAELVTGYRKAAAKGNVVAMHRLGECYQHGTGVQADIDEAIRLHKQAANKQYPPALQSLAECYALKNSSVS